MGGALQNRIGVRFGVAHGDGSLVLQDPSSITAVTTHKAADDALVETLDPLTKVATGDYYGAITLASYAIDTRYYLKVAFEMVAGHSQTTKRYFYITAEALDAVLPITIEMTPILAMGANP